MGSFWKEKCGGRQSTATRRAANAPCSPTHYTITPLPNARECRCLAVERRLTIRFHMNPVPVDLLDTLKHRFGFASFRPLQEEIIRHSLDARAVFALLSTG